MKKKKTDFKHTYTNQFQCDQKGQLKEVENGITNTATT